MVRCIFSQRQFAVVIGDSLSLKAIRLCNDLVHRTEKLAFGQSEQLRKPTFNLLPAFQ